MAQDNYNGLCLGRSKLTRIQVSVSLNKDPTKPQSIKSDIDTFRITCWYQIAGISFGAILT